MNKSKKIDISEKYFTIFKGTSISLILSIISIFTYAFILIKSNVQENTIKPVIMIIIGVSILIGSSIACSKLKKRGMLCGLCIGGVYIMSLYILSSIAFCGFGITISSLFVIIMGIILGGIGGVIGVNIRK